MRKPGRILQTILGLLLIGLLFYWLPLTEVLDALRRFHPEIIVFLFVVSTGAMLTSCIKLHLILGRGSEISSFLLATNAYYVGTFFNNFIPTSVGGDVVKATSLLQIPGVTFRNTSFSVIVDRLSGTLVLVLMALYFLVAHPEKYLALKPDLRLSQNSWLVLFGLIVLMGILAHFYWKNESSDETSTSLRNYLQDLFAFPLNHPLLSIAVLLLSLLFHLVRASVFVLMVQALGYDLELTNALFILPIIAFGAFLPVSFGGLGIREGIITACLNSFSLSVQQAFAIALVYRFITVLHSIIGGILYMLLTISLNRETSEQ